MKKTAILVNTARGAIVDEAALAEALKSGAIAGAALDCFAVEPLPADSPLRALPNVILTPHMIGHTIEAHHSLEVATRENLDRVLSGRPPRYVVNPAVLPAWTKKWGAGDSVQHSGKVRAPVSEEPLQAAGPFGLSGPPHHSRASKCYTCVASGINRHAVVIRRRAALPDGCRARCGRQC